MTHPIRSPELDDTVAATGVLATERRESVVPSFAPERLAGRYELLSLLGSGGMGTVYRARDLELDEVVALKMLRDDLAGDEKMLGRFRQEVKLARKVTHCNVARTFDIGEHGDRRFLTMELIEGTSLAHALEQGEAMPMARSVEIAHAVCAGLSAAHAACVVHRDLKPDNVMLANDGRVVITDFGIARNSTSQTLADTGGSAIGTPAYMAPEQVEGKADLDARADIYALGAILFELFTGARAWEGDSVMALVARRLIEPPPDPRERRRDLPEQAAHITMRAMARDPRERYQTVEEVAHALRQLTLVEAAPPSRRRSAVPPAPGKSVAVLPFRNAGPPADQYLADGLTDDLIDLLSVTDGLRVCARGLVMGRASSSSGSGEGSDAISVGRSLGVQVVVEGTVRRVDGRLRVSARLSSVEDGFQLWARRLDHAEAEFYELSDAMARAVAEALTVRVDAAPREAPRDPVAFDLYLRARHEYHKHWRDNVARAIELYEQALARTPDDPLILASYAMALARRTGFGDVTGDMAGAARRAADRALATAPHLATARVARAHQRALVGEAVLAAEELCQVLAASPDSVDALELSGRLLGEAGPIDEGIRRVTRATELDPMLIAARYEVARLHALRGDRAASEAFFGEPNQQAGIENIYWANRCRVALWQGDVERARAWRAALDAKGTSGAIYSPVLMMLHTLLGEPPPAEALRFLQAESTGVSPYRRRRAFFAIIGAEFATQLGRYDDALTALENADAAHTVDLAWLDLCPTLAPLRSHPRFRAVHTRIASRARQVREALGV